MNLPTVSDPLTLLETPSAANVTPVIHIENAGVRYRVPSERINTFKEYIIRIMQRKIQHRQFWALREVNLDIFPGEVFGLIGSNGAGKSTLLKLIARVLRPTEGRIQVRGRVAPLLEFGAAFHQDLTGRENIYLNGALMGFSQREMEEKIGQIIDFAELGEFIDAPLRTFSSGMVARLGFAVATDVQPDILIVDEVLSVGDESFQRKSYARMEKFHQQGATIMLVSHSMDVIRVMCQRAAWLHHGHLEAVGPVEKVIQDYRKSQV